MKIAKSQSFTKLAEGDVNYYGGIYTVKLNLPFQWAIKKGW